MPGLKRSSAILRLRPQGYLFLATKDSHLAYLRDNFARQQKLGLTTARLLSTDEIRTMLPQLRSDDILAQLLLDRWFCRPSANEGHKAISLCEGSTKPSVEQKLPPRMSSERSCGSMVRISSVESRRAVVSPSFCWRAKLSRRYAR